jgi:pimeloyl-ACP methyl ester carboxylesterase
MASPTDIDLVDATAAIYAPKPGDFDKTIQIDPLAPFVGIRHGDGFDLIAARGSMTPADWIRDSQSVLAVAVRGMELLGMLPWGFARHLADTYAAVKAKLRPSVPAYLAGHSLGAPEVTYLAAEHIISGYQVAHVALFESPKPGTKSLTAIFKDVSVSSYWNDGDPIPDAPLAVPFLLPWEPICVATRFSVGPEPDALHPLARHAIELCQQGVRGANAVS